MYFLFFLILLPRINEEPPVLFPYRGIYLSPFAAVKFKEYLPYIRNSEINCVVVDFKSAEGYVAYNTNVKFAKDIGSELSVINLENLMRVCRNEGIRLVGRIVVFQDSIFAWHANGEYSIKGLDGRIWKDGHGKYWVDPCLEEVRVYNIEIAKDLANRGVPEIQFDYIRFPSSTGDFRPYRTWCRNKEETIAKFLEEAREELKKFGVKISGDIFGCVLWMPTLPNEGQSLKLMAPFLDVVCPMLYPSHFSKNHEWSEDPREREYNVIFKSIARGRKSTGESRFVPYIQGFDLRAPGFGPGYIENQITAVQDARAWGYIVWHSAGRYDALWELMNGRDMTLRVPTKTLRDKVREVIDEVGKDIELLGIKDGVVKIKLPTAYKRSPWEYQNAIKEVESKIKKRIPEVKHVKGV